jgi:methylenetetrahydrofolate dehydrogenase (NADP+)/methenyltetrahydrofolate cyclohydrolase
VDTRPPPHRLGAPRERTAEVIDGRRIAAEIKGSVASSARRLRAYGVECGLATVLVGDDYAAHAYERRLARMAAELGITHRPVALPATCTQEQLLDTVARLNDDGAVSGILVLRPLPGQLNEVEVFRALSPVKDIEAVHPENAGLLTLGTPRYLPSTPAAVFRVLDTWLDETGQDRAGFYHRAKIVVVGRSNNVGKPAVSLAYERQAAVESIDEWASDTNQLGAHTRRADVLIVAAGVAGLIKAEHVREGAVVLDVGINPLYDRETGTTRVTGDVDFDEVAPRARAITPVPGGIGPVTDVWLLHNTVLAARNVLSGPVPDDAFEEGSRRP